MADPVSIIGTVGAVANIIEVASKTIKTLHGLHSRWRDADFTILNLIAQLTALRAALTKIQEWIDRSTDDMGGTTGQHHQLTMDIDLSMTCVRMLIGKMDAEAEGLKRRVDEDGNDRLDLGSKIKVVFGGNGSAEEWQKMIERQVSALTLLLTASTCNTIIDQRVLLEKSSSRKIFKRVKDDTASLYVHRDTSSIYTRCTDTLSKLSLVFNFDHDLFVTKVYERAVRGSLKASLRRQQADVESGKILSMSPTEKQELEKQERRSKEIDVKLAGDAKKLRREGKVLLMGGAPDEQEHFVKQMMLFHQSDYTRDELLMYKTVAWQRLISAMQTVADHIRSQDEEPLEKEDMDNIGVVSRELEGVQSDENQIPPLAVDAMEELWKSEGFLGYFRERLKSDTHLHESTPYYFDEIRRLSKPDYVPIEADIVQAQLSLSGIHEVRFSVGSLGIRMIRVDNPLSERNKWIHQFENVLNIIYVVDLCSYDEVLPDGENIQNKMIENMALFSSVVESRWFKRTSVTLLFTNVNQFKQKLAQAPLNEYFPDYKGGNDFNRAAKYLSRRFNQVNRAPLILFLNFVELTDASTIRWVAARFKETIINNDMIASGQL